MAATLLGKYLLHEVIGNGGFGEVRRAQNIETGQDIAIKFTHFAPNRSLSLFAESEIMSQLQGYEGIPKVFAYGKQEDCEFMVTELLGKSLMERFRDCGKRFGPVTVGLIAGQVLDRLEFIHGRGYLHRDIKPQNLLTSLNPAVKTVYLTDFGLAKKYINEFHIHIPYRVDMSIAGTLYFASNNTLRGIQPSRRDDLECLVHVLIYFLKGELPWGKREVGTRGSAEATKLKVTPAQLCSGLPNCILQAVTYVKGLQFEEKPNYAYLKRLFQQFVRKKGENCRFDWENISFVRKKRRSQSLGTALIPMEMQLSANRGSRKLTSIFGNKPSQAIIVGNAIRKESIGQTLIQPALNPSDDESASQEDTIKDLKLPIITRKAAK